jgi:hypothetical protein
MILGIRKIEYIDSAYVHDYSQVIPGSTINLASYMVAGHTLTQLPFTPETGDLQEQWTDDDGGKVSKAVFSASIRKDKEIYRSKLQGLMGRKCIFLLTLISGVQYIIGSKEFVPKVTYSDGVSGLSSSEFTLRIENESLHGILLNSAS